MNRKILIVDDDRKTADLIRLYLERDGFQALIAHDGRLALDLARQKRPDLIVLDLMLPTVDGRTVLREFAENPLLSDIPIIVVTGVDPMPDLPHAAAVLPKPCDPDHIAQVIADHLSAQAAHGGH